MAPKKSKAATEAAPEVDEALPSISELPKGGGTLRENTRVITIYGPAKCRKTTSLSKLPRGRTKWLMSDPNCAPTLRALNRLPHPDDIYELNTLDALRKFLEATLQLAEKTVEEGRDVRKVLGIDFMVMDSWTQYADWHQKDTAEATGQRFMGDDEKNNGWTRFNAEFGACLDLWAALGRYITVIGIVHAKDKFDRKKGEYASFSLPPQMAQKLGRLSNWILLKDFNEVVDDTRKDEAFQNPDDPFFSIEEDRDQKLVFEDIFYTRPMNGYIASVNSMAFKASEPGKDICLLLEKDGLL